MLQKGKLIRSNPRMILLVRQMAIRECTKHWRGDESYLVVLASVIITVVDADLATIDAGVAADAEVVRNEGSAVGLQDDVALQESTLRDASVDLLGLGDHNRLVLKVVEDSDLSDASVLEAALNNVLLEVALESQNLCKIN